ncbi:MAG: hypothetical protein K6E78_09475 [Treponema sp.]|nr:hypothetical protein [Treponema sp.]
MKTFVKNSVLFLLITFVFVEAGFSKSKKKDEKSAVSAPLWITEEGRNKIFPKTEFVSASAFGSSESESKNKAAAEISAFIKSQVASNVQSAYSASDSDGVVSYRKAISQNIDVSSQNFVYQLEYTVPFYSSDYGMYICVAYINRSNAFSAVKPKLEKASQNFKKEYTLALESKDDFEKLLALEKAKACLKEFYEVYDFALAILPEQTSDYSKVDLLAGECQVKINQIKKELRFVIDAEKADDAVKNKVSEIFSANDLIVVNGAYDYKVILTVQKELLQSGDVFMSYPFVNVEVKKGGNSYYSFSKKLEKCAGFDKEAALRRVDLELCKSLEEELLKF